MPEPEPREFDIDVSSSEAEPAHKGHYECPKCGHVDHEPGTCKKCGVPLEAAD